MKKILSIIAIILLPFFSPAQDVLHLPGGQTIQKDFIHIPATILAMYLVIAFILAIIRSIFDYRLKFKMIEKGVPDEVVKQFLQPDSKDIKNQAIKWCLLLAGIGLGLSLIAIFTPYGIHSVAIMAFSLALSFLGYYFFIRRSNEK